MKILVIEDLQALEEVSRQEVYSCEYAKSYQEASEKIWLYQYDCILLYYTKNKAEIFGFLELLEKSNRLEALVVLSPEIAIEDKVKMLNIGADDYITKPFHFAELNARIHAVIRRKKFHTKNKLFFANMLIEFDKRMVSVWNDRINFTRKEYDIFLHLVANKDKVVSKLELAEYSWGDTTDQMDSFNILSAHIKNIRKKMKEAKAETEIRNSYGVGYQIIEL
jgi:DNA-binding response OmpR family regulator